jgi:SAM-dependent methyltransferase
MMLPEQFFELLLKDLEVNPEMQPYYKFLGKKSSWHFRRNYFLQRLQYLHEHIGGDRALSIWDCGCGYGTTCLFLAMNGIKTHGTTLEFYFDTIRKRLDFWSAYGDTSLFTCSYENLYDAPPAANTYDVIIVQDTLHHLEPINDALSIFYNALKPKGRVLSVEENGNNLIQRAKLYRYRGNKYIISIYDEKLRKEISIGNENIRSLKTWQHLFQDSGFAISPDSVQYVRYYLPIHYRFADAEALKRKEQQIQLTDNPRREFFFFGLNFVAEKVAK